MPPGLPRRPAPSAAGGLAFGDIVRILKQRFFLILFVWVFHTGATGALTWYLAKHYERFKAEAMIEVESQGPKAPMQIENSAVAVDLLNRWLTNQAQLVK